MTLPLRFEYRAARPDGGIERGTLVAEGRDAASAALAARGLFTVALEQVRSTPDRAVGARDVAVGLRILATLVETGIPLTRALAAFEELAPTGWRPWLPALQSRVREGRTLADALSLVPMRDGATLIGIVRAGERGGQLAGALGRTAVLAENAQATRDAIIAALMYPVVLLIAGSVSLFILIGVVVPRFALILADLGQSLPPATRALIALTDVTRAWAIPVFVVLAVLASTAMAWIARDATAKRRYHALLLHIPIIGSVRHTLATARFSAALAGLLESGLPLSSALPSAAEAAGDAEVSERTRRARERVLAGASFAGALRDERAITPAAAQLIRAGEEAGRLVDLLRHAAGIEESRGRRTIQTSVRLLEPAIIVAFALIVAFVAAALLQAVYAVRPA